MKYRDFKKIVKPFPLFSSSQIGAITSSPQVFRNQVVKWKRQGLVVPLKKGLYILNRHDRGITPSRVFIANQLVFPSYVSNEYALSFYGLIPDRVEDITSITTKKTLCFTNEFGVFRYQHISSKCYAGYREMKDDGGFSYFIATPEKAIVDFLYLNLRNFKEKDIEIFTDSYHFQNVAELNIDDLRRYTLLFNVKKLVKVVNNFIDFIVQER